MLRLRKNKILPQQVSDLGAFIFVVTMIPTTYIWEVAVVSRSIFAQDGYYWYIHMVLGVARGHQYPSHSNSQRQTWARGLALLRGV